MKIVETICCSAAALLLGACAAHPLPEQFEGNKTTEIVTKIRCETRHAIETIAIRKLVERREKLDLALAKRLQDQQDAGLPFDLRYIESKLTKKTVERVFYDDYIQTGFALNFTFDITESNHNDSEVDVGKLFGASTGILAIKANADFDREGTRHFIVSNTFQGILEDPHLNAAQAGGKCPNQATGPNLVYPVTGDIGLEEVILTFVDLNTGDQLAEVEPDSKKTTDAKVDLKAGTHKIPVLADTLTFMTKFEGSINPMVTLMPTKHAQITKAMFTGDHTRLDKNTVIIGLSYEPRKDSAASFVPTYATPYGGALRPGPTATVFSHRTTDSAETRAINATVEQPYNQFILNAVRLPGG